MKTRQGFVSNSSSSSFVFLGWEADREKASLVQLIEVIVGPEKLNEASLRSYFKKPWNELNKDEQKDVCQDLKYEFRNEEDGLAFIDDEEQGAPAGKSLIGIYLAVCSSEDYGFGNEKWTLEELKGKLAKLADTFGVEMLQSLGITDSPVIRLGTMMT